MVKQGNQNQPVPEHRPMIHPHAAGRLMRRLGPAGMPESGCRAVAPRRRAASPAHAEAQRRGGDWASKYGREAFALAWPLARHEALVLEAPPPRPASSNAPQTRNTLEGTHVVKKSVCKAYPHGKA
jgi:hypothetical protein